MPVGIRACLFDLDGVLTRTGEVHALAWKRMFDDFLESWAERAGVPFRSFELPDDYATHIDGRLRLDGVRGFLRSRGIELPEGDPGDPPEADTVNGLGTRKNALVLDVLHTAGVGVYEHSVRYARAVAEAGLPRAVVSASRNCAAVLAAAGLTDLFDVRVDGVVADAAGLRGKPAADMFLAAAAQLGVEPGAAAVFEDAVAGVSAGRAGDFGWVVGVDRLGHADALRAAGADIVVTDLGELLEES